MMERDFGPTYQRIEITVVPDGHGFRVFPVLAMEAGGSNLFGMAEAWKLPVLPTRDAAEELGCLIAWEYLDGMERLDRTLGEYVPIEVLE
jgi:hypothetical protein